MKTFDIHKETAKRMFGTENVTPEMRLTTKRRNFLELYGSHDLTLNQHRYLIPVEMEEFMKSFDMNEFEKRIISEAEEAEGYTVPKDILGLWEQTVCEIRSEIKAQDTPALVYAKELCDKLEHSMCTLAGG